MRYELTDHEWTAIKPMLPNKPRGVAWVNEPASSRSSTLPASPETEGSLWADHAAG